MINAALQVQSPPLKKVYLNQGKLFPGFGNQKPFLKWAGGKSQMLDDIKKYIPKSFNTYIEPFIGGGAIYFSLNHPKSIISDLNEELVITYQQVKENVGDVICILEGFENTEEFYYKIRSLDPVALSYQERAARLIYLNKTCFNGLFRVNKKGVFNVPFGKRNGPFLNKGLLEGASNYLKHTDIYHADYKEILQQHARSGDLIFLDPPYQPVGKFSDFKRYTKEFFYEKDQIELSILFKELVNKGCFVILTNSEHPLIFELYQDFQIEIVETKRLISSNPSTRKGVDLIVLGGL
ncbi:MAG TPA: Dam family site-specific DNA-(adenine-N6)-methyltransferase [Mucilaginibacter sp.]|nr:Dam family site-specific DNA-(adenine-N6)-methyltransferase [Mucilaginibacter sp.]